MEKEHVVSIWIGKFSSEDEFTKYLREVYTDEGDVSSRFMNDFSIDYIDNHFMECLFFGSVVNEETFLKDFSYANQFIDKLPGSIEWDKYNSIIMVYNFSYTGKEGVSKDVEFIGEFGYQPE